MTYNLLDEKWIPVLYNTGKTDRVGIQTTLTHAHQIRGIAASNPMDRLAILRFFLALLYWCRGDPPDQNDSISAFPPDWFKKLNDNKDCFELLGDGKRFYQRKAESSKAAQLSANYLVHEVPTGTNAWHFRHSTDTRDGLCKACCAMGLLRLPLFATSGGRGKPPGVNQKPPVYVVPLGTCLAETLRFSWRKVSASDLGKPTWEKPDLALPKRGNVPLLVGLTWMPRRVWLENPDEPAANCIGCGRSEPLIRKCVFAGIGSAKTDGEGKGRVWADPHTIADGEDILKPSDALGAADAAAGKWTQVASGTLASERLNHSRTLWVVSFATVKNDKYLEAMEYQISFSGGLDDAKAHEAVEKLTRWQKETWKLVRRATPKGTSRKHLEIPPMLAAVGPQVEAKVSAKLGDLISGEGEAWEQAAGEYSPMMTAVAKSLSPGFTASALRRRRQIAYLKPYLPTDAKVNEKAGVKKGSSK